MTAITGIAKNFFEACEAGKGWEGCKEYCEPGATFSAQAEPLAETRTLQQYTDWMKGLLTFMPDGRYALKSFATDEERESVCAVRGLLGDTYWLGWPLSANWQACEHGLCVRDGVRRGQDPAHDEDLACGIGHERARVGLV
jgi:hypothetical protein